MNKQFMKSIAAASVELGPIPFNLYSRDFNGRTVLFCRAGYPITTSHKQRMSQTDRVFYVGSDDEGAYLDYAYERIEKIVTNPEIRLEEKTKIVHDVGKRTVHRLLENPRSGSVISESQRVVENFVELIIRSPEAAGNLFALSSVDAYTFSHSLNVCTFCLMIGEKLFGGDRDLLWELGMGGLLHDVGKTQVDQEILFKPARLNERETEEVRKHAIYSYELIKEHSLPQGVLSAGRSHHERVDGSGYPDGLKGEQIHPFARVTAVADVYDAITSDRVYRRQKPHVQALSTMAKQASKFDYNVLEALVQIVLRNETLIDRFMSENIIDFSKPEVDQEEAEQQTKKTHEDSQDRISALS